MSSSRTVKKPLLELEKSPPNNTNINENNLNNVNSTDLKEVVENSGDGINKKTVENEENLLKSYTDLKENYLNNNRVEEYSIQGKYMHREKELLAREIAEELEDKHSLGAF